MARKRVEMGPEVLEEIQALMTKGGTVQSITSALRAGSFPSAAPATVARRMADMRREVNAGRSARRETAASHPPPPPGLPPQPSDPSEQDLPRTADEIPEGTTMETYDRWIARAERMADDAAMDGDLKAVANAGRLVGFFMSEKRKATPEPVPDPNDDVDMVRLGAEVEVRFLKMIDMVLEEM